MLGDDEKLMGKKLARYFPEGYPPLGDQIP